MEKGEPSLVPEWLRSGGSGNGAGCSSPHFASSQTDGPVLALPTRNRSSHSIGNSDSPYSSFGERSSSGSRRSSSSNGSSRQDRNSYLRSYSSSNRSQRDRDRESLTVSDNWDLEYSAPLRSLISGRTEDTLGRSQSMIPRRQGEILQRRRVGVSTEPRNGSHRSHGDGGNDTLFAGSSVTSTQKGSFEREFPVLGYEDRPKTPDIIRVSSPGLSRGIPTLSIGNSTLVGNEGWTSALAEVPTSVGVVSNITESPPALQSPPPTSGPLLTSGAGSTLAGRNMAEALVQAPARPLNTPQSSSQLQRDELAVAQSKKLIPMTPSLPKVLVNPSVKLKPKTAVRSNEVMVTPKNGSQQPSALQLGSQSVRGTNARVETPKSPSGRLLLLKPVNGVSTVLKDGQSLTASVSNKVANGQSVVAPSVASVPLKKPSNLKLSSGEHKVAGFGLNHGNIADKKNLQSRNEFLNSMRNKSINNTSGSTDSVTVVSTDLTDKSDKELKELSCAEGTPVESGNEVKCNGQSCAAVESSSQSEDDDEVVNPNEEEKAFLRSLGWDENAGDDGGLTEEEINAFYQTLPLNQVPLPLRMKLESCFLQLDWIKEGEAEDIRVVV